MSSKSRRILAPAVLALITVLASACGSSSDGGAAAPSGDSAARDAGIATAKANIAAYATPPTTVPTLAALPRKPAKKKVGFVVCADPSCTILAGFLKTTTRALGWELVTVNASATDPGAAVQQLIDARVDYIGYTGVPLALIKQQVTAAKDKGIRLFGCYGTEVPEGPGNNLYSNCYDSTAAASYAKAMADFITVDSKGSANVLQVNIPAYPILEAQEGPAKAELAAVCPGCSISSLAVTGEDAGGGRVPQKIASYLQSNPKVDYVYLTFDGLSTGVQGALKSAGLSDKVKVVGIQGTQAQFTSIADGTPGAWVALPQEYAVWTLTDEMARLSVDAWDSASERKSAVPPYFIVSSAEEANKIKDLKAGWPGPAGYQDAFKKAWGV
jgi:ribose transport system substrate-binding protein